MAKNKWTSRPVAPQIKGEKPNVLVDIFEKTRSLNTTNMKHDLFILTFKWTLSELKCKNVRCKYE